MQNRWLAGVLCGALIGGVMLAGGCKPKKTESGGAQTTVQTGASSTQPSGAADTTFKLRYSSDDGLDPFSVKTRGNQELGTLLYEGLARLDDAWTPQPCLASSIDTGTAGRITAVLRDGAKFSDGSPVTAQDVKASFDKARNSTQYKALLSGVSSASVSDEKTVVFQVSRAAPNLAACLLFPVVKTGADAKYPLGTGRYAYSAAGTPSLEYNTHSGANPVIKSIQLTVLPDTDVLLYSLDSQVVSYYFTDLADGQVPGTANPYTSVPMSHLVYLGINSGKEALKEPAVRRALSLAADRAELVSEAYVGRAQAAKGPLHTVWAPASELSAFESAENIAAAVAQLAEAGYNKENTANTNNKDKNKILPEWELLVAKGSGFRETAANRLASQLAQAGITAKVTPLDHGELASRVSGGKFDLYLGELKMTAGLSLDPWLRSGGAASAGVPTRGEAAQAYDKYLAGEVTLAQFADSFAQDMPFVPLCWREGMAAYRRTLTGVKPTAFDTFYGIEAWKFE